MQAVSFAPLVVPLATACIFVLTRGRGSESVGAQRIFRLPIALAGIALFGSLFTAAMPNLPGVIDSNHEIESYLFYYLLSTASLAFAGYLIRYRVIVGREAFEVGAFWRRRSLLKDIASVKLIRDSRSGFQYFVYLKSGRRIQFSGFISDFQMLVKLLSPNSDQGDVQR